MKPVWNTGITAEDVLDDEVVCVAAVLAVVVGFNAAVGIIRFSGTWAALPAAAFAKNASSAINATVYTPTFASVMTPAAFPAAITSPMSPANVLGKVGAPSAPRGALPPLVASSAKFNAQLANVAERFILFEGVPHFSIAMSVNDWLRSGASSMPTSPATWSPAAAVAVATTYLKLVVMVSNLLDTVAVAVETLSTSFVGPTYYAVRVSSGEHQRVGPKSKKDDTTLGHVMAKLPPDECKISILRG